MQTVNIPAVATALIRARWEVDRAAAQRNRRVDRGLHSQPIISDAITLGSECRDGHEAGRAEVVGEERL